MASYRYERDIDPRELAPRKERQYTRKEKWANWWDYNLKWVILIGIAVAFVAYNFIGQYFFVPKPDYNIAVVAPYYLPDDTVTMAGTTKLATDVQGGLSSIFLLYDPAGFEDSTGTLRYLDGNLPAPDSDDDWWNMVYKWTDCPVLAGLDLGEYRADTTHAQGGDSQQYLSDFYIGMRGAWNTATAENLAGGEELWQALTAGAVSTLREG